jgi:hypothetical protein
MKMIINTQYADLLRFIFSSLREERNNVPYRDNFFLIKNLNNTDTRILERHNNYVIVSKSYATLTWGRLEIFEFCRDRIKSRRKPVFDKMSDKEFEKNIKVFLLTGKWVTEDEDSTIFPLYANIDNQKERLRIYFDLREQGMQPGYIFYSVLTFCSRVLNGDTQSVSAGYAKKIHSKKSTITRNFKTAMSSLALYKGDLTDEKVLYFIQSLGKV